MRKIIFFICFLWSISALAQEPPYTPMRSNYKFRGIRIDSLFMPPAFADTGIANTIGLGTIPGNVIRVDSIIYIRFNDRWRRQGNGGGGGSTIDTTSLSNRIDLKVPYTGATGDVDLGVFGLNANNIKINGTAGNGHIDLKHQSADATGQGNSTALFANSQGYLKWKNDNLYYSTLAMPQTANRVYTYQDKNYTLGDSADIVIKMNKSDSALYYTKYRSDTSRTNIYNFIGTKASLNQTTNYIPYNNGYSFRDSYLVNDTANSELKTVISGNPKGFNFNLNTGLYYIGDSASPTNFILNNSSNLAYINDGGNVGAVFDNPNKILYIGDVTAKTNNTSIILDDATGYIKSSYQGSDIGLKLDFANNTYLLYANDFGLSIDASNRFLSFGDYPYTNNGTTLNVDDVLQTIKTQNQGNDIGLKLDFAFSDYNLGTSTANFQIKNDSIKLNGLTSQSGDSVVNINPSGKLGKVSIAGKLNKSDSTLYQTKSGVDSMRTNIYSTLNGKVKYTDTASMLTNYQRMTAFPIATFGAGSGAAGDTSAFSTTALYGSFYNSGGDTIVLTSYTAVCLGTSPSITPTIYYNDSINVTAGATKIVTTPAAVTSTTTGNTVTSLNNTKIPPGNFVWVVSETVTTKPTYFSLTLIGYRKRP